MTKKPDLGRSLKDYELVFVTENNPSIHYGTSDYIHIEPFNEAWADEILRGSAFVDRWLAEKDTSALQLIPYIVCHDGDKVLTYSRKSGGEKRLEGKRSLGIGGHVNIHDKHLKVSSLEKELEKLHTPNNWDVVIQGAIREASEELDIDKNYVRDNLVQVGTMYTPTDGMEKTRQIAGDVKRPRVSEVHMAIIYILKVPSDTELKPNEGMVKPRFIKTSSLKKDKFEFWSQLIINNIDSILDK